jgi:sec-independent protein translocase protein TatA
MNMDLGLPEILIVLVIVLLLFGPGRISKIAGELGKSIRSFRDGLQDGNKNDSNPPAAGSTPDNNTSANKDDKDQPSGKA